MERICTDTLHELVLRPRIKRCWLRQRFENERLCSGWNRAVSVYLRIQLRFAVFLIQLRQEADEASLVFVLVGKQLEVVALLAQELTLARAGLIEGAHGKGGGYRLTREPADYTVGEILREAEGTLSSLAGAELTPRETASGVAGVWQQLDARIAGYLDSVLLSSLTSGDAADEYVI